jgi:CheY-like chemotaxis protein
VIVLGRSKDSDTGRLELIALIADDMMTQRLGVADAVRRGGYDVMIARNGDDALVKATQCKFDFIVLGIEMCQNDILSVAKKIRDIDQYYQEIPIIGLADADGAKIREVYLSAGIDAVIPKKFGQSYAFAEVYRLAKTFYQLQLKE